MQVQLAARVWLGMGTEHGTMMSVFAPNPRNDELVTRSNRDRPAERELAGLVDWRPPATSSELWDSALQMS
nr:hypothetical protein CFP56_03348 [Quercus suber]